jgi:hypothetical protein
MIVGPSVRIAIRYGIGGLFGAGVADAIINDPDLMTVATLVASTVGGWAVERVYQVAKRRGWAT